MSEKLRNYLKLWRIKEWRSYFFMTVFGFLIAKGFLFPPRKIIIFWLMVFSFLAFGFSINDCFDTKEDRYHQNKEKLLVGKDISFKKSLIFSLLIGALGLVLSIFFGLKIFLFCFFALLIGFFYSAPPLRFKSRPFLDLISHGLFAGAMIFILPLLVFKSELTQIHYLIAFSIFCFSMILELRNHLEDYESDKKAGLKTTVWFLGYRNSERLLRYSAIFYPLILLPIFLSISWGLLPSFLISSLVFLLLFLFSKNYQLIKNYRILDIYVGFSLALLLLNFF